MNPREKILSRLREAAPQSPAPMPPLPTDQEVFADQPQDLLDAFVDRLKALKGEAWVVPDVAAARDRLQDLLRSAEPGPGLRQRSELINEVIGDDDGLREWLHELSAISSPDMAEYAVGLTEAEALVARTGSLWVRSPGAGGRRLSVLPPLHIAFAGVSRLVTSLDSFLGDTGTGRWSYGALITGPSRTADIEKVLVLGAHGPKRLAVIIVLDH